MTVDLQKARQEWFQTLQPLRPEEIVGLWRGVGIPSDHPLDGVLENLQWFGKRFHADLRADALLFQWRSGRLVPINPAYFPIGVAIRFAAFGGRQSLETGFRISRRQFGRAPRRQWSRCGRPMPEKRLRWFTTSSRSSITFAASMNARSPA